MLSLSKHESGALPDMLRVVVPFPPEFAARYRAKGYWEDRSIASVWQEYCRRYAERVAVIDGDARATYASIDARSTNLARTGLAST